MYLSENYSHRNQNQHNIINTDIPLSTSSFNTSTNLMYPELLNTNNHFEQPNSHMEFTSQRTINNNQSTYNNNNNESQSLLSKYIFSPFQKLLHLLCGEKREVEIEEEDRLFSQLPSRTRNYSNFTSNVIKNSRIGIIVIYSRSDIPLIKSLITSIQNDSLLCDIIQHNYAIYTVLGSCSEGRRIAFLFQDTVFYPSFVFVMANSHHRSLSLQRTNIVQQLEGNVSYESFRSTVMNVIDMKQKNIQFNTEIKESNAQIIEEQNLELKRLEQQAEIQRIKEIENKKKEDEMIQKEQQKQNEIIHKAEVAKKKIKDEPKEHEEGVTLIVFRFPDGVKRIQRRFYIKDTVQDLFDFVMSLGNEIYTESSSTKFSIIQTFPFKTYDNRKENTLEMEQLFPNAVLQIKEESDEDDDEEDV